MPLSRRAFLALPSCLLLPDVPLDDIPLSWQAENGNWLMQGGSIVQTDTAAPVTGYLATVDAASDFALTVTITTPPAGYFITGVCFRVQDLTHFVEVELNNSPAYNGWAGFGCWSYSNSGVFQPIVTHYLTPANDTTYTLRLSVLDTLIVAECAGVVMAGTSALYRTSTRVGLFEARDTLRYEPPRYTNFRWAEM